MYRFADPHYLFLLLLVPLFIIYYLKGQRRQSGKIKYSDVALLKNLKPTLKQKARHVLFLLRIVAYILIIFALARPQSGSKEEEIETEGVDIVLAVDVSTSMLAEDFQPQNRLGAAKMVAKEFVEGRTNDRLGMVVFAGQSFTQCPLTVDYGVLISLLEQIKIADKDWDGTAIGMGIANAVNRLKNSKTKSKVIILLTDGVNNSGQIDPLTAAQIAATYDIKIYTIGAGKKGTALYPVQHPVLGKQYVPRPVKIDEEVLKEIAGITGGKYFRATDEQKLREIYQAIGEMEQTKIKVHEYTRYTEYFVYFLMVAILLLIGEIVLANTFFKRIP
ncbi:MAG: VWA domain-containing protein [Caldithrix sp.]|nr:VWA domain-containing protein [Caldithrix sp.]